MRGRYFRLLTRVVFIASTVMMPWVSFADTLSSPSFQLNDSFSIVAGPTSGTSYKLSGKAGQTVASTPHQAGTLPVTSTGSSSGRRAVVEEVAPTPSVPITTPVSSTPALASSETIVVPTPTLLQPVFPKPSIAPVPSTTSITTAPSVGPVAQPLNDSGKIPPVLSTSTVTVNQPREVSTTGSSTAGGSTLTNTAPAQQPGTSSQSATTSVKPNGRHEEEVPSASVAGGVIEKLQPLKKQVNVVVVTTQNALAASATVLGESIAQSITATGRAATAVGRGVVTGVKVTGAAIVSAVQKTAEVSTTFFIWSVGKIKTFFRSLFSSVRTSMQSLQKTVAQTIHPAQVYAASTKASLERQYEALSSVSPTTYINNDITQQLFREWLRIPSRVDEYLWQQLR